MPSARKVAREIHPVRTPLRAVCLEEDSCNDGDVDSDATLSEPKPLDLDEPWTYSFRQGDDVWIKTVGGNWHSGKVTSQTIRKGQTREKEGYFYPVEFDKRLRKYFAPLNGEIKPDTPYVRRLLKDAGWL